MEWWTIPVAIVGGLLIIWGVLVLALYITARRGGEQVKIVETLRLVPDVVRLLRRLIADPDVSRGPKVGLGLLLVYLILPIDLIPDFIPVVGYLDDAIIVAVVLRFVVKHAGLDALTRNWPGTGVGLAALRAAVRV